MIARRKPLNRTPLRKVSKKRAKESRIYSEKRKAFLEAHPFCQVWLQENWFSEACTVGNYLREEAIAFGAQLAVDIHHRKGRTGTNYLDESTWMAVSRRAHIWIHNHPEEARARGYITT